jgi:hypothetical protein
MKKRYTVGNREVQLYMAASDGNYGFYVGSYGEVTGSGVPQMYSTISTGWSRTSRTAQDLRELDSTLVHPCTREDLAEVEPGAWESLVAKLEAQPAQVPLARSIAEKAHAGQVDKIDEPYIGHPQRVAESLSDPIDQATAWLHDVIEDCGVTAESLLEQGIDPDVVAAVQLLTRRDDVPSDRYYARIAAHPIARAVKLADIADNLQPGRTARLDDETRKRLEERYAIALLALALADAGLVG